MRLVFNGFHRFFLLHSETREEKKCQGVAAPLILSFYISIIFLLFLFIYFYFIFLLNMDRIYYYFYLIFKILFLVVLFELIQFYVIFQNIHCLNLSITLTSTFFFFFPFSFFFLILFILRPHSITIIFTVPTIDYTVVGILTCSSLPPYLRIQR